MEKATQLSVFLRNVPGELGRFAESLSKSKVNILAMFIQNASLYMHEMFEARGKAIKRTASAASYGSVMKEAEKYSLIRVIVNLPEKAEKALKRGQYWVNTTEVLVMKLDNRPGKLAKIANQFGEAGININYVYGSGASDVKKTIYVFNVPDVDKAIQALSIKE